MFKTAGNNDKIGSPLSAEDFKVLLYILRNINDNIDFVKILNLNKERAKEVLQVCNMPHFGIVNKAKSVDHAVVMLGIETVKKITLLNILGSIEFSSSFYIYNSKNFWTHAIAVAVGAVDLGEYMNLEQDELNDLFIAGLIHDIGKIILIRKDPKRYLGIHTSGDMMNERMIEKEQYNFGTDHSKIGQELSIKWNLSKKISDLVRFHHEPNQAESSFNTMISAIYIANRYVHIKELGIGFDLNCDKMMISKVYETGLGYGEINKILLGLESKVEQLKILIA